jgi:hypothetical protein
MRTNAKQRPNQQKADATEQQTTADPKTRDTSTGTGASHHPIHTHTHTHTYNTGEGGRAGQASTGILRRPVQSAAEGTRPRDSREQRGGVRHGGQGMWQWQHAGQAAGKKDAAGAAVRGLLAVIAVVRDVLVRHPLPGRCAVYVARLCDLPLCLLC